jgi:hypothetical protein
MDLILAAIAKVIETLFTDPQHIALLVSIAANVSMAWFILRSRNEDREDRRAFIDTLGKLTAALTELRIAFAAAGIRGNGQ